MLYIFFCSVTALLLLSPTDISLGLLSMIWGFFGLYRYRYLSSSKHKKFPEILTLPSRILFDLNEQQQNKIDLMIDRFLRIDVLTFFSGAILFILWGLYCSLYPADTPLVQSYWNEKKNVISISEVKNYYFMYSRVNIGPFCPWWKGVENSNWKWL